MSTPRNIPWPRVIAESAIIVASILLALWVDAWWADRQRQAEEQIVLESLSEEINELANQVRVQGTYIAAINASTRRMVNAMITSGSDIADTQIDQLIGDLLWHIEPSYTNVPLLESLLNSGEVDLLSNGELRRLLGSFMVNLNGFRREITRESHHYNDVVLPFITKNAALAHIFAGEWKWPGDPSLVYPSYDLAPVLVPESNRSLLESREFQNILLHRLTTTTNVLSWQAETIEPQLEDLIGLIDSDIDRRN